MLLCSNHCVVFGCTGALADFSLDCQGHLKGLSQRWEVTPNPHRLIFDVAEMQKHIRSRRANYDMYLDVIYIWIE